MGLHGLTAYPGGFTVVKPFQPSETSSMKPIPAPPDLDSKAFVSQTLRQCALIVDPRYGRLGALADEFDLHETTLNKWINNGRIPRKPCRRLLKRFGRKFIDFDRLVGEEGDV
jgi:hypothetical protein